MTDHLMIIEDGQGSLHLKRNLPGGQLTIPRVPSAEFESRSLSLEGMPSGLHTIMEDARSVKELGIVESNRVVHIVLDEPLESDEFVRLTIQELMLAVHDSRLSDSLSLSAVAVLCAEGAVQVMES